jgi:hypothetical protein
MAQFNIYALRLRAEAWKANAPGTDNWTIPEIAQAFGSHFFVTG